ncbi:MAG: hypothetical protein A2201_04690 [Alicyclobacillus sp. RIFOXYA1_FULL_53_8]|nr:MAG: hypothetical protein A2201_04690 [Alicyclobacillus sp. RIFOXYA1_FULL_53_8]
MTAEHSTLEMTTRWGESARFTYLKHSQGSDKLAVVFPGLTYKLDAPLMWYATKAAFAAGCDVLGIEYGFQANRSSIEPRDISDVADEVAVSLEQFFHVTPYQQRVFIAKSLGTTISDLVLQQLTLPVRNHVYLTPLPQTIPFMQEAENILVVVGDQDELFDSSDIAQISNRTNVRLHVIPQANHLLEVDEDYNLSLKILRQVTTLCGDFCISLR